MKLRTTIDEKNKKSFDLLDLNERHLRMIFFALEGKVNDYITDRPDKLDLCESIMELIATTEVI